MCNNNNNNNCSLNYIDAIHFPFLLTHANLKYEISKYY